MTEKEFLKYLIKHIKQRALDILDSNKNIFTKASKLGDLHLEVVGKIKERLEYLDKREIIDE